MSATFGGRLGPVAEEVLDIEAVEELEPGVEPDAETRHLPEKRSIRDLEILRNEGRTIAIAAAGGVAAGVATVAVANIAKAGARRALRRKPSKRERAAKIVASRSFMVDVHVLGNEK